MASPGEIGYRLAADRARHERCVMRWPSLAAADDWRGHLGAARDTIAIIARAIAELEPVLMVTDVGEGRAAEMWLHDGIDVVELPGYGGWIRDAGPSFVIDADGHRIGVAPRTDDECDRVAMKLCAHLGIAGVDATLAFEGGAIVSDGAGRAVVSEPSLLGPGEGPGTPADQVDPGDPGDPDDRMRGMEAELARWLGIDEAVWLAGDPRGDVTGGHVDKLVTIVDERRVLLQSTDRDSAGRGPVDEHRRRLEAAGFAVETIDALPHDPVFGETHAVPFVNLYHANGGVIVPLSGSATDADILAQLQSTFPDSRIVGVPGRILAFGGGGIRRLTLPVPAGGRTGASRSQG
jgi:agmatine deiminase